MEVVVTACAYEDANLDEDTFSPLFIGFDGHVHRFHSEQSMDYTMECRNNILFIHGSYTDEDEDHVNRSKYPDGMMRRLVMKLSRDDLQQIIAAAKEARLI